MQSGTNRAAGQMKVDTEGASAKRALRSRADPADLWLKCDEERQAMQLQVKLCRLRLEAAWDRHDVDQKTKERWDAAPS